MYKGYNKLTQAERRHLKKDAGVTTTDDLKHNFEGQQKMRKPNWEPCWECRRIAKKLGYPV